MKRLSSLILAAALSVAASACLAQTQPTWPVDGFRNVLASGTVSLCMNSAGRVVPPALCDQSPGITKPFQDAPREQRATVVALSPNGGTGMTGAIAANNTTGVLIKAAAGVIYSLQLGGIASAPGYLKLYDKATAPTCGTDTPVKRLIIPAASTAANGAGSNVSFPVGIAFYKGIGYCVTTGITDADTTAPSASNFLINIDWK